MVREEFPQVRLITRESNIGAPAWNDGFAIARGDHVLILDDDCYLPPDGLRQAFAAAGVDLGKPVVTTCGSGITASVLALGLHVIGHKKVAVYDGSWTEWASQPDTPVEAGR